MAGERSGRKAGAVPDAEMGLTQLVAAEMARQGLTLDAVARRGGLSVATVAAIRAGTRGKRPRLPTLHRLARGLGVPADRVVAAAGIPVVGDRTTQQERTILSLVRRMTEADQVLAERLLRELLRTRELTSSMDDGAGTADRASRARRGGRGNP